MLVKISPDVEEVSDPDNIPPITTDISKTGQ